MPSLGVDMVLSDGWKIAFRFILKEESPGTMEERCWLTASKGDFRESATESKPPFFRGKGERVR